MLRLNSDRYPAVDYNLSFSNQKLSRVFGDANPDKRVDTNDYPTNHPSGIKTGLNNKVRLMFMYEAGGKQILELVGMRAKLYFCKMLDGSEDKKCKE